jgi:hypothetical protein
MPGAHLIKNTRLVFASPHDAASHGIHTQSGGVLRIGTNTTALSLRANTTTVHNTLQNRQGDAYLNEKQIREKESLRMGFAAPNKDDSFAAGLVPPGAAYETGDQHLFLSKNGAWAAPSPYVGAVYENFRDLADTPNDWGQVRDNQFFKFNYSINKLEFTSLQSEVENLDFSTVSAQSFVVTSDENAKENIEMFNCADSIPIMNEIDMVTYSYKNGGSPKLGVIAQTVEKVMPHAVTQGKEYKQVDFTQLVSLLMATTKVLLSKVSGLETKINALAV